MVGIVEIWQTVIKYHKKFAASGELEQKRQKQALDWLWSLIEEGLRERFDTNPEIKKRLRRIARAVEKGETSPTVAADELLFFLDNNRLV
jgi:LAO/AO transport system kinase